MAAQGLSLFHFSPSSATNRSSRKPFEQCTYVNLSNPFIGVNLSVQSSNFSLIAPKRRGSTVATVSFSLPTTVKEQSASDKIPKWSARSIKAYAMGEIEARKLKYPNTGTEALLLGILVEGTSLAAKFLRENGISIFKVREEVVKLLGRSEMYYFSPEHPPLTEPARRALNWAIEEKLKSGDDGEITTAYMLLGIWSEKESAGYKLLSTFGFNDEKAKEVAKNIDKDIIVSHK